MNDNATSGNFTEQLIALRTHYQTQIAVLEHQATHAREQVAHINALLIDQLISTETTVLEDGTPPALLAEAVERLQEALPLATPSKQTTPKQKEKATAQAQPAPESQTAPANTPESPPASAGDAPDAPTSQPKQAPQQNPRIILPLQPPYVGMSKIDAVSKIMQEQPGKILHVDDLIHALFGDLSLEDLKAERQRMKSVMTQGIKSGRWVKVKTVPSSYVIDSVVEPQKATPSKSAPRKTQGRRNGRASA